MKKVAKNLMILGSLVAMGASVADGFDFEPYAGVDLKWQTTRGKNAWKQLTPRNYAGATIYLGSRFCENYGIELGYSQTAKKHKTHTFGFGNNFFNNGNTGGAVTKISNSFRGWHFDVNGYWPLDDCWELIGSAGIGFMKPKVHINIVSTGVLGTTTGFFADDALALISTKGKNKGVFRLAGGTQYELSDCVGIRGLVRWETTSKLRVHGNYANIVNRETDLPSTIYYDGIKKMFKDSISISLGVFWKF